MPVPLALPLGLAAGAALSWLGASATRDGLDERAPARVAAYLGVLVLGPAAAYLELVANGWANLYLFDLPSAFDLVLVCAVAASPSLGERIGRQGLSRGDIRVPLGVCAVAAIATVSGVIAFADRVSVVTSHAAFHADLGGAALVEHRAGAALLGALVAIALGVTLAFRGLTNRRASPTLRA